MAEKWRLVPGWTYVQVSSLGNVRTLDHTINVRASAYRPAYQKLIKGQIMKPWLSHGYWYVGVPQRIAVQRLVCLAFHGLPPPGKEHALHKDGIKTNIVPSNLYWGSHADNMADCISQGVSPRGERNGHAVLTEDQARQIKARRISGERGSALAREYGVTNETIYDLCKGRTWSWL
jgi:hypothetical protein